MIVVTGAAGFIGSCLISKLNSENFNYIVAVDDFSREDKKRNLDGKKIRHYVHRDDFIRWLYTHQEETEFIFHIGARTDTTLRDWSVFETLNVQYSMDLWEKCVQYQIPLIYASSAATYGKGANGFSDNESHLASLAPLNPYGNSKHTFDQWALSREEKPFYWCGLKFFNVYGPNEYHKSRMASVVYHAYQQIKANGEMKLFRSHSPDFSDGEQKRDFIYVKDVVEVMYKLMHHRRNSGIYNLGTGTARSFLDLTHAIFNSLGKPPSIRFIDTPKDIRDNYQYYTQATMQKLNTVLGVQSFTDLEKGISEYVKDYLVPGKYF